MRVSFFSVYLLISCSPLLRSLITVSSSPILSLWLFSLYCALSLSSPSSLSLSLASVLVSSSCCLSWAFSSLSFLLVSVILYQFYLINDSSLSDILGFRTCSGCAEEFYFYFLGQRSFRDVVCDGDGFGGGVCRPCRLGSDGTGRVELAGSLCLVFGYMWNRGDSGPNCLGFLWCMGE